MAKVTNTASITIDDSVFAVEKMSPQIQQMVAMMDEWRQRDADLVVEHAMVKSALRDIQNSIYATIMKEREETAQKAEAMGVLPPAQPDANTTPAE